jgi:hypothetical protein
MVCGGGEFSIFVFLFSLLALVSVPLRGKEGAGLKLFVLSKLKFKHPWFPSPCGVRRVRDTVSLAQCAVHKPKRFRPLAG